MNACDTNGDYTIDHKEFMTVFGGIDGINEVGIEEKINQLSEEDQLVL